MAKFINPFVGYDEYKNIFGEELSKPLLIADVASLSKEERAKYDKCVRIDRDHLVTMDFAKQEGKAEGLPEGERTKALSIARSMKSLGSMDKNNCSTNRTIDRRDSRPIIRL